MMRDVFGGIKYWNEFIKYDFEWFDEVRLMLSESSKNPIYDPQFTFDFSKRIFRLVLRRYSRGDDIRSLSEHIEGVLDAWELSNKLSAEVCAENQLKSCRSWTFDLANLSHYNWCFWLVGLALVLEIPEDQWQRLLVLIGGEGEDELLDRIIASREQNRRIGSRLLHPKPYARLLKAINAPKEKQAVLLRNFVEHWYAELARKGKNELWWYFYGDPDVNPLEMGSYFGRWCLEAVTAVKAFGLDDSLCLGHEHYPGDLLRPDGPTTHPVREEPKATRWFTRFLEPVQNLLRRKD